jgi:hypothetical protein
VLYGLPDRSAEDVETYLGKLADRLGIS